MKTMLSTLIRYTSQEYADSILKGDLYLSSLSSFWDLKKGKVSYQDVESGKATEEDLRRAIEYDNLNQQDFSEGIAVQVPHDVLEKISPEMNKYAIHDARFRIEAYGYCNLLCFFRVDASEVRGSILLDADNIALLAKEKGIDGISSYQDIENLPMQKRADIAMAVSEPNILSKSNWTGIVQLPSENMDRFGNIVMVVKNEEQFIKRVLEAVKKQGGECITGDVRYHKLQDRINPQTMINRHSISLISDENSLFDMKKLLADSKDIIRYGSLDKYERFADQKEWRVCWLPKEYNDKGKILHVGDISDIIDIVDAKHIRRYLLKQYSGYLPGILSERRRSCKGTVSYKKFKENVEEIDGKCRIVFEIG